MEMISTGGCPRRHGLLVAVAAFFLVAFDVGAQSYPSKTVRIISPFPTGPNAIISNFLSEGMRESFGQGVIVDNRPGAGGSLALEAAAKSQPDGHTLLITSPILTITPVMRPSLKLDAVRDFAPISLVGTIPTMMAVHPSVPARNIPEFVKIAKAQPGRLTYGSSGVGSTNHLVTELFSMLANIRMTLVPYKSNTYAVLDLVRGDVDFIISTKTSLGPYIPPGKLRLIAVLGTQRISDLPNVPTAIEQGMPDFIGVSYYGLLAPAGTPAAIIDRLARETQRVLNTQDVRKTMAKIDMDLVLSSPAAFAEFIRKDADKWAKVVQRAGLKVN